MTGQDLVLVVTLTAALITAAGCMAMDSRREYSGLLLDDSKEDSELPESLPSPAKSAAVWIRGAGLNPPPAPTTVPLNQPQRPPGAYGSGPPVAGYHPPEAGYPSQGSGYPPTQQPQYSEQPPPYPGPPVGGYPSQYPPQYPPAEQYQTKPPAYNPTGV